MITTGSFSPDPLGFNQQMVSPEHIKKFVAAHLDLMLCQIPFQALVQVSATATLP